MVDAATSSVSNIEIISIPGSLTFDLTKGLNMQSIYDSVINKYSSSTYTILGIDIPIIGLDCLIYKTVDPNFDIKESIQRLFEYLSKLILKPIFEILEALAKALGGAIDDLLTLPIFDLKITDLFDGNIWEIIEKKVKDLYENSRDELISILSTLGIPWPFFDQIEDPELQIRKIVKDIASNLLNYVFKAISKILKIIRAAMLAFDLATYETPVWSKIWDEAVDAILGSILGYLAIPITLEDLFQQITNFAENLLDLPVVTFQDLMNVIEKFKLPIFGLPLDWKLPLNLKVEFPEKDFSKIISDMITWLNNFLINILKKFIEAITSILEFFGVKIGFLTSITIPITLCAIENN